MVKPITPENINSNSNIYNSNIYINFSNRLYLSVARQDVSDKLVYVYTLWRDKTEDYHWTHDPCTDIATFNNRNEADLYEGTIQQIIRFQSTDQLYSRNINEAKKKIDAFNDAIKSIRDNQKVK